LICIKVEDPSTWSEFRKGRSEYLAMAQNSSRDLGWTEGWGVVRLVHEKLEFVAFFEIREDAEAAVAEAGIDRQVCWLSYKDGLGFTPQK
jgi:hypothetical protein